jgi:hypothetical protein
MKKLIIPKPKTMDKFTRNKLSKELAKAIVFKAKLNAYIEILGDKLFKKDN